MSIEEEMVHCSADEVLRRRIAAILSPGTKNKLSVVEKNISQVWS